MKEKKQIPVENHRDPFAYWSHSPKLQKESLPGSGVGGKENPGFQFLNIILSEPHNHPERSGRSPHLMKRKLSPRKVLPSGRGRGLRSCNSCLCARAHHCPPAVSLTCLCFELQSHLACKLCVSASPQSCLFTRTALSVVSSSAVCGPLSPTRF